MWKKIAFIVIISSVVFSISDYFYTMQDSYNKYLDGEYFFRYKATTKLAMDQDAWMTSLDNFEYVSSMDFSDTKTMLLYGGESDVYACNPHDGVCTVIYGSQVVDDFPVTNLQFSGDDEAYFNGTKQLTYDEYIDYVKNLSEDQLNSDLVSSNKVASFNGVLKFTFILIGVEAAVGILLFILHKNEQDMLFDIVLVVGALYCIFFEIVTAFAF